MSLPKPLMFTVGLIDQITRPVARISKQLNNLTTGYQKGTYKMATGAAGVAASGYALYEALQPAIEMDKALGQAKGVGIAESALRSLKDTALEFSLDYGHSAIDVIQHAEKMRGALGNMPDHVLTATTRSSATLAKAVGSDADTVSKYIKNLYGNFDGQANAMGRHNFVDQISGMAAYAKKMGTEFGILEGMIDGMHSLPSTLGVAMDEQFAVLTMLERQMGEGDAVTQYTNYLEGIMGAQEKLGVNLTDGNGALLPMVDVLEKIKPLIAGMSGLEARAFLDDAGLGDGSLMIINMIERFDQLKNNIDGFSNVNGLDPAIQMAKEMTDQSERLGQSWYVIRAAFGAAILPAFNAFVGKIADMGKEVLWFTEMFPNLTRVLGYAAVGVLGLVAAGGLITVVMGAATMATTAWGAGTMLVSGIFSAFSAVLGVFRGVMLAVNIAMYANPIGLIVAGVVAAIAAVGALIYYWDDLKAAITDWGWLESIGEVFDTVWGGIKSAFLAYVNWVVDKLNMIPGVDIDLGFSDESAAALEQTPATDIAKQTAEVQPLPAQQTEQVQQVAQQTSQVPEVAEQPALAPVIQLPVQQTERTQQVAQQSLKLIPEMGAIPKVETPPVTQIPLEQPATIPVVPEVESIKPVRSTVPKEGVAGQVASAVQRTNHIDTINVYPKEVAEFRVSDLEMYAS